MRKFFLTLLLTSFLFSAETVIDGIAITIDGEVITLYEIKQEQALSNLSVRQTVDQLIRLKLEHLEAKERHIKVTNQEVIDDLKDMAKKNNLSLSQLYDAMNSSKHLTEFQVKEKTKERLLKDKIFNAIAMSEMEEPSDDEVEEYYELHLDDYTAPKSIDAILYSSSSKQDLQKKVSNPMMHIPSVKTEKIELETAKINPRLAEILIKTKDNHFSPILPQGKDAHMSFYVVEKIGMNTPPLALIRTQVENTIMEHKREQILSEHFQRMRVNANIKVLRLPKE
jgi:FKBP-type peptidyl-prolyl cis-trans isomerase (trigger factor)